MRPKMNAVIEVDHLTKRYRKATAVDDLSFEVEAGTVTGFLGPNGAGKTTTMRCILGLARPTSGEARVSGKRLCNLVDPAHQVGAVLESSGFHPGRSGRAHLEILTMENHLPRSRVEEALSLVGLEHDANKNVKGYSLGMRQRLSLAGALLGDPQVLILDEPANGLDPAGIRWMRQVLRSYAAQGRAVLISSHLLSEMAQLADDVVIIANGRLMVRSSLKELTASTTKAVYVRSPQIDDLRSALENQGFTVEGADRRGLKVKGASTEEVASVAAQAGALVTELQPEEANLEDIFLDLTKGKGL
ncbi:ABC transporter ATP-binding protein [Ferrimicrobium acidiphilum]